VKKLKWSFRMPDDDLSKLRIKKSVKSTRPIRARKRLYAIITLTLLLFLAVVLYMMGYLTPSLSVETAGIYRIYPSQSFALLNASGYVVAQRKAAVASKITGRLDTLMVEEGSRVKKGDVIARLENEDARAARDQAAANLKMSRANLEQAKAELRDATLAFDRSKELITKGYIARADFDMADARYRKAVAGVTAALAAEKAAAAVLQGAEVNLEYALMRAPFDAVVLTKDADVGDIVTPLGAAANAKASVVTIADMESLQVEADVSESNLGQVKVGQPCEIQLDAVPDTRFRGQVHTIVPTADRSKATVLVKVAFIDKDIRILPEMSAKVAFLSREVKPEEKESRLAVNRSAVIKRHDRDVVFLVSEKRAVETAVKTGAVFGDMIEIMEGVRAGDRVIIKNVEKVKKGSRIKTTE
jgi:RND family efflux transporter MFP subunit